MNHLSITNSNSKPHSMNLRLFRILLLAIYIAPYLCQVLKAVPGARTDPVSWLDLNGKFWIFGGKGYSNTTTRYSSNGNGYFNDLWRYDPLLDEWTWMKGTYLVNEPAQFGSQGVPADSNIPGGRGSAISWTSADGSLWLFGGYGLTAANDPFPPSVGGLNDLWKYTPSTNQWTWMGGSSLTNQLGNYGTQGVPSSSNFPGARSNSGSWTASNGTFWLFGGSGGVNQFLNDIWQYNPSTQLWVWVSGNNTSAEVASYGTQGVPSLDSNPGSRQGFGSSADHNGTFWLFGGYGYVAGYISGEYVDLWKYNPATNEWTWMSGNNTQYQFAEYGSLGVPSDTARPGERRSSQAWIDLNGTFWLFGGYGLVNATNIGYLNDLWRYTPSTNQWTWMGGSTSTNQLGKYGTQGVPSVANIPTARMGSTSQTGTDGTVWLFGGSFYDPTYVSAYLNDLWRFNTSSNEWTWVSGSNTTYQLGVYLTPPSPPTPASNPTEEPLPNTAPTGEVPQNITAIVVPSVVVPLAVAGIVVGVILGLKRRKSRAKKQVGNPLSRLSSADKRLIPHKSVTLEKEIGAGSFGKVYLGKWQATKVAVKVGNAAISTEEFLREAEFQMNIPPHPNIVQLLGISTDGPYPLVILEYCNNGSLDNLLFDTNQKIPMTQQIHIATGIAKGLYHLHTNNIVHRDLAARNILMHNGEPKISDFGMSRALKEATQAGKTTSNIGPIRWMAPESIANQTYSFKSDVWMFGIILYEITARQEPHIGEDILNTGIKIRDSGLTPTVPEDCPPLLREIMQMCWNADPNARPTMEQLCNKIDEHTE